MGLALFEENEELKAEPLVAGLDSAVTGRIGELLTEVQLLARGHDVARPSIDNGIDLVVNHSTTVQVKTAKASIVRAGQHQYRFHIFSDSKKLFRGADIYVLCGYDEEAEIRTWWVIPRLALAVVGVKESLSLYPGKRTGRSAEFEGFIGRWDYFDATHQDSDAANHPSPP